jgi:hypothetical protein
VVAPFVQGRLLQQDLSVTIDTACAHCGRSLRLTVDSDLGYEIHSEGARPLVFEPHVDWRDLTAPNIIDFY